MLPEVVAVDPMVDGVPNSRVLAAAVELVAGHADTLQVRLVGPSAALEEALGDEVARPGLGLVDAGGTLRPHEDPALLRGRPDVPVRAAVQLVAQGTAAAVRSASPAVQVLTAASFLLGRAGPASSSDDVSSEAQARLRRAARPGLCTTLVVPGGILASGGQHQLKIVDAGVAQRCTAGDLVGRMLEVAEPGDRLAMLDARLAQRPTPLVLEALELGDQAGLDVVRVDAREAVSGAFDVVGCTPDTGAVMVQVVRAMGASSSGASRVTGVAGDVAVIEVEDVVPESLMPIVPSRASA